MLIEQLLTIYQIRDVISYLIYFATTLFPSSSSLRMFDVVSKLAIAKSIIIDFVIARLTNDVCHCQQYVDAMLR
jgi:hypothetical protein